MRRRQDNWINATHILKAAGFDKPARTRILEREVQKDVHEKIQGGYGKYQGAPHAALPSQCSSDAYFCSLPSQARGFPSSTAKHLPSATTSTIDYGPSLSLSRAMRARRPRLDMPASRRPPRPGLLCPNGAVSRRTARPACRTQRPSHTVINKVPLFRKSTTTPTAR